MKRHIQMGAFLLGGALLSGCGGGGSEESGTENPDLPVATLNKLTVAVRDANTTEPIANAQLTATGPDTFHITTNAQGVGEFNLMDATYQLTASHASYQQYQTSVTIGTSAQSITIDLEENPLPPEAPEEMFIFYSDENDSYFMQYWGDDWGSGASIEDVTNDPDYTKVLRIGSGTNWGNGAGIAWGNDQATAIDTRTYNFARFNLKPTGFNQVEVHVQGFSIPDSSILYSMDDGQLLPNGWIQFEVPIPSTHDLKWFALVFPSAESGEVLLSNLSFITKEEQLSKPIQAAPIPTANDAEVFSIYSDTLTEDKWVSVWRDDWWSAPIHSFGEIDGDNYSRYEIVGQGANGGVVGIQYGIEYGSVDVSKHDTWNIDLYAEAGIDRIQLQLVSPDGSAMYEISNPTANEWTSYAIPFNALTPLGVASALNTMQMQMAGIQMWGQAGKALFVDNFYFSGDAVTHSLSVNVEDETGTPLANADVYIGIEGEHDTPYTVKTDVSGVAQLTLSQGRHKVKAAANNYGVTQEVKILNSNDTLTMRLTPLKPGPLAAAPTPTVDSADVISLFSDSLTSDHWINFWSDPWWNPPTHEMISIAGNQTSKFTITPDGVAGGVTGIQYGIENPVDASSMTGLRFDFFATNGVTKAEFQLLSVSGPSVYPIDSIQTGSWISVELPFKGDINQSQMQQLGMALWGTSSDSVYLDNIYFY
ncbi:carboxypeptidase-like regulatory domain-containing protein [Vibrio parahaemolyticus]|uniref:carboxypeptidase-like regulatory domain-containing protein n=1 Tax=Vibrio mediterranei TaxID=689 RepID=UPI004069260C